MKNHTSPGAIAMKDATADMPHPMHLSVPAQLVDGQRLTESSIRRNRNYCSPRANIAFAALDAMRIIGMWWGRVF
jgi:hypothetical protein